MISNALFSSEDMTWTTPQNLFNELNNEFHFDLDVCCSIYTTKCRNFFTEETDGLSQDWSGHVCWMNPPYGKYIYDWMKKAYEESLKGAIVVALIPARTDTKYWHDFCMNASEIRFIKGRLKFGNSNNSAPFPSAIIVFDSSKPDLKISSYNRGYKVIFKVLRMKILRVL